MLDFLRKKKTCSIPQEEMKMNQEEKFEGFQKVTPTIHDLKEVREMEELNPDVVFLTEEEEEQRLLKIREDIKREKQGLPVEDDESGETPYQADLSLNFRDMESADSYAFRWGYHMGNWG